MTKGLTTNGVQYLVRKMLNNLNAESLSQSDYLANLCTALEYLNSEIDNIEEQLEAKEYADSMYDTLAEYRGEA